MQMYKRYNSEKGMCVIKKYRNKYKMTIHRCLRIKGMEECDLSDKIEINNRIYPKIDFKKADYTNISVYVDDLTGVEYYDYDIEPKREEKRNSEKLPIITNSEFIDRGTSTADIVCEFFRVSLFFSFWFNVIIIIFNPR